MIHSSPANARLLMEEIERLSQDFTVFAFDTPGFGLSDPLPLAEMTVADLADAMAATLSAIAMPPCPVFGTHTGAAIALELGVRYPECVTGMVLDGVPAFTDAECTAFFGDYFRKLPVSDLGGHYSEAWTRFRDQSTWFPWSERVPANLNAYDLNHPTSTHLWVTMFFDAAEHYTPAYRAASFYGARAIAAAAELEVPTVFTATETDMLYGHLQRLPPLKAGQAIVEIGTSYERKRELIAATFARYRAEGRAPAHPDDVNSTVGIERQFIDSADGQIHIRYAGHRSSPALLLVHDTPGSSEQAEPLIARLAERYFVVAPDLPGCGESDAPGDIPSIEVLADTFSGVLERLGVDQVTLYGIGFGSSVALAMATLAPANKTVLAIQGILLPDHREREELREKYVPPIAIEETGQHWYRTWLMLRDSQIYWPWYDRRFVSLRRIPADFSARPLHRWTMDVMRARESYGWAVHAALDHDAAGDLITLAVPLVRVSDARTPLSAHDGRLAEIRGDVPLLDVLDSAFITTLADMTAP